jgi:hypothetical protein
LSPDSADRDGDRLAVDVLVEPVRVRAAVGLERRGRAALEDVEPVDIVGLPDVDTRPNMESLLAGPDDCSGGFRAS